MFLADYDYINGVLNKDGALYSNFLIMLVVALLVTIVPTIWFFTLYIKFCKAKEPKFLSLPWLIGITVAQMASIICTVLGWIFFYGEGVLGSGAAAGALGFKLVLIFVIMTFALTAIWYAILLGWAQNIWILVEENKISNPSLSFSKQKILKIIKDEGKGKVYINYLESKSNLKKVAFSVGSTIGQFILTNEKILGAEVSVGNQEEFFKEKMVELKTVPTSATSKATPKTAPKETAKTATKKEEVKIPTSEAETE